MMWSDTGSTVSRARPAPVSMRPGLRQRPVGRARAAETAADADKSAGTTDARSARALYALAAGLLRYAGIILLLLLGLGVAVPVLLAWLSRSEKRLRFNELDVPVSFQEAGYSGRNLAQAIVDEVYRIRDSAGTLNPMREVHLKGDKALPPLDVEISGQSISVTALVEALQDYWSDSTTQVGGQLIRSGSSAALTVRAGIRSKRLAFAAAMPVVPQTTLRQAAEFVLREAEPYVLASYFVNTDPARARALLDTLTRTRQPRLRAQALTALAVVAMRLRDTTVDRERLLRLGMSADSAYPGSYVDLATLYNWRKRNLEALAILDSAPRGQPGWDARATTNRAGILNDLDRYAEALASAEEGIAAEDDLVPRLNAAKALLGLGRYREAQLQLDHAMSFQPDAHTVQLFQAVASTLYGDDARGEALGRELRTRAPAFRAELDVLEALKVDADSAVSLAAVLAKRGRRAELASWLSMLGYWLSVKGEHAAARTLLTGAAAMDGEDPLVAWRLMTAACRRGAMEEAWTHFRRFDSLDVARHGEPHLRLTSSPCGGAASR